MSFWTDIRDTVESAAVVAGNYFLPGSGLVTSNLASSGSQDQLNSGLGRAAMIGSGVAGGLNNQLSNYGKFYDAAGNFITGNESSAQQFINADIQQLIGQGYTPEQAASLANASFSAAPVGGASATMPGGTTDWTKYLTNPSVLGSVISGGAGLLGAGLQANAAREAAQGIADANISSNQLMARMNEQNRARQEPFYQAGLSALPDYVTGIRGTEEDRKAGRAGSLVRPFAMSDYQADPGYGFRMSEGMKALDRSAASRGNLLSGSTLKSAERFGQDMASQEYNNAYNRYVGNQATQRNALAGLTGFAPTASSAMQAGDTAYGSNAANLASNTANAMAGAGATRASSYGNALAGIGQNIYNTMNPNPMNAMMAAYMQSQMAPKTGVTG